MLHLHLQCVIKVYSTSLIAMHTSIKHIDLGRFVRKASWALGALQVSQVARCAMWLGIIVYFLKDATKDRLCVWTTMCPQRRRMPVLMSTRFMVQWPWTKHMTLTHSKMIERAFA